MECITERKEALKEVAAVEQVLGAVNEELEEHLLAINENTSEIQENTAFMFELDNKLAKLNERIDEIHTILSQVTGKKLIKMPAFEDIDPLTEKERNVFLNIYTEEIPMTYSDLAKKISISVELAREYVLSLIEKGIPIQKSYKNARPHIMLNAKFRNLQAKKNILKIEQKVLA